MRGFPGGSLVKNAPANAGDAGLIPGQEDLLEKENATHSSILASRIPRTDEPGGLESMGSRKIQTQPRTKRPSVSDVFHGYSTNS